MVKDSGDRTVFATGSVRDMQGEDKGSCHLLPLDTVALLFRESWFTKILRHVQNFIDTGDDIELSLAIRDFCSMEEMSLPEAMLQVSIHYKEGAEKYKPNNWKLGIPISSYISSGLRHLFKHVDGHIDEKHDRAFIWNMLGAMWTMEHKPEMDDLEEFREKTKE
jgi:hypothetical protein